jgi:hypothetical protein
MRDDEAQRWHGYEARTSLQRHVTTVPAPLVMLAGWVMAVSPLGGKPLWVASAYKTGVLHHSFAD